MKALKVKRSTSGIKAGTKVRSIRLIGGVDGRDFDCKIDGCGAVQLKSSVVKKGWAARLARWGDRQQVDA